MDNKITLDELYFNPSHLRYVLNTILDFVDEEGKGKDLKNYLNKYVDMNPNEIEDLVDEGLN